LVYRIEKTKEFEKKFSEFVGSKYASVVTSGTVALYIGLKALGIKWNDEVIVPDLTFVASPNSVEMNGGKTKLIDIESRSLNLDLSKINSLITKKTKAIMPVDFNGRSTDIEQLKEFSQKKNLFLIEDACHAIGSYYKKKHMGTLSDIGVFSFSTPKIITTGQGGMIVTNDKKLYERCLSIKDFGRDTKAKKNMRKAFQHTSIGYNFKFTEFQAAVGIAQLKKLKDRMKHKKNMFKIYRDSLSNVKNIDFVETNLKMITPWMIDILLKSEKQKNCLIEFMKKRNIETRIFYPAIHNLIPYRQSDKKYPVSSDISKRGLWLPSSVSLKRNQIERICNEIKNFFK
jgi:perosamine synthetase